MPDIPSTISTAKPNMVISIYNDVYGEEKLTAIKDDAEKFQDLLKKFGYAVPSETEFGMRGLENIPTGEKLVTFFGDLLKRWKRKQPVGETLGRLILYYHGHGAQVDGNPCLLTPTWEAVPMDELVNKVAELHVVADRYYIISDCCANSKMFEDEVTKKRVSEAAAVVRGKHFLDNIVWIKAVPEGHEASSDEGKTFTSALVAVLSEKSLPLKELEKRLREKQEEQGSKNFPKVEASLRLTNDPFPL